MDCRRWLIPVLCGGISTSSVALAQNVAKPDIVPDDISSAKVLAKETSDDEEGPAEGWTYKLSVGATGSFNHSSNVVGQTDGSTLQLGTIISGMANLLRGQHTWENGLKIQESQTRTPQLGRFVKSADELDLLSTYIFHFESLSWLGVYGRFKLNSQIFEGEEVRTVDVDVVRTLRDGTVETETVAAKDSIGLTGAFEPLVLKETVGAVLEPLTEKYATVTAKAGLGFQHVIARDGFTLADDDATPELEVIQLDGSTQGGAEVEIEGMGELAENITWGAKAEFFYPMYTSIDTPNLSGIELLNSDLSAKLSIRLASWLSLDYVVSAKRLPLVIDEWQIQNGVIFTAGFDVI